MGMICVLAEKPSVARDIARVLGANTPGKGCLKGGGYVVTWAVGHLVTQVNPEEIDARWKTWRQDTLPMLPENIPLKVIAQSRDQFQCVKTILNAPQVDSVICATDAGREGELIFRRIYQMAGCRKPFRRLWISSMTEEAIAEGFANLRDGADYDGLYASALCRSDADWLVGMNGSRAFTLRYDSLLSVGRVQTPTLSILVKRALEIRNFVPENYWEVQADFGGYRGTWIDKDGKTRIPDEKTAKEIVSAVTGREGEVLEVSTERKRVPPPLLYDLTTLQREANARYGFTAQKTLNLAQALYEKHKLLTYPRTDSRYLSHDMRPKVQGILKGMPEPLRALVLSPDKAVDPGKRVYDDAKLTDHHAIIPTGRRPGALTADEQKLYEMVARQLIAAFYPDMEYDAMSAVTGVGEHKFLSRGRAVIAQGWQAANPPLRSKPKKGEEEQALPQLQKGQRVPVKSAKAVAKKTTPPSPYTENTLLAAMENAGKFVENAGAAPADEGARPRHARHARRHHRAAHRRGLRPPREKGAHSHRQGHPAHRRRAGAAFLARNHRPVGKGPERHRRGQDGPEPLHAEHPQVLRVSLPVCRHRAAAGFPQAGVQAQARRKDRCEEDGRGQSARCAQAPRRQAESGAMIPSLQRDGFVR